MYHALKHYAYHRGRWSPKKDMRSSQQNAETPLPHLCSLNGLSAGPHILWSAPDNRTMVILVTRVLERYIVT